MYQKFLNIKWKLNKQIYKSKGNLLFVDRGKYYPAFVFPFLACAFSKKYKLNNIILTDLNNNSSIVKIYKSLGFSTFLKSFDKFFFLKLKFFLKALYISLFASIKIYKKGFFWFIKEFKINNIPLGDLIYDLFIRTKKNFVKSKPDIFFFKLLFKSIFRFLMIESHIKKNNIKFIFCCTEFYAGNDGLSLRIASFRNIKNVIVWHDSIGNLKVIENMKKIIFFKGPHSHYRNRSLIKNIKKKIISKRLINNFIEDRKNFKTMNTYTINSFKKANKHSKKTTINFLNTIKKKNKKIGLFACHALSDAAHGLGINYAFSSYYEQLKLTLDFLDRNYDSSTIWIFKAHPSSRELKEEDTIKNLIKSYKNKRLIICPLKIRTKDLMSESDYVISGRETISLEAVCYGKISINCGFSAFSDLDLLYEAKSKNEYFNWLKNLKNLKKPNEKTINRARKVMYLLENNLVDEKIVNKKIAKYKINKIFNKYVEDKNFLSKMYLENLKAENKVDNLVNLLSKSI